MAMMTRRALVAGLVALPLLRIQANDDPATTPATTPAVPDDEPVWDFDIGPTWLSWQVGEVVVSAVRRGSIALDALEALGDDGWGEWHFAWCPLAHLMALGPHELCEDLLYDYWGCDGQVGEVVVHVPGKMLAVAS